MKNWIKLSLISSTLLLAGCSFNTDDLTSVLDVFRSKPDAAEDSDRENTTNHKALEEVADENLNKQDETTELAEVGTDLPSDLIGVFEKMKQASDHIKSVTIQSTAVTREGATIVESDIYGEMIINPYTQYVTQTSSSEGDDDIEFYITNEDVYMYIPDTGWMTVDSSFTENFVFGILGENQINHLMQYPDAFKLTEDEGYFIISYVGTKEQFKEVVYGGNMLGDSFYTAFDDFREAMEIDGEIEMKVSKETFFIEQYVSTTNIHLNQMIVLDNTDHVISNFTYNTVDEIIIPEEAISGAIKLPGF